MAHDYISARAWERRGRDAPWSRPRRGTSRLGTDPGIITLQSAKVELSSTDFYLRMARHCP